MNDKSQLHGLCAFAILGPIVAVGVCRVAMNEPTNARANTFITEFLSLPEIPDGTFGPDDNAFDLKPMNSPFWFEEVEMSLPVMPTILRPIEPETEPDPDFRLSTVLPSATKSFAVINGKPHSQGDEIVPGWTLIKIAGKERYVIVQHSSGRRIRVQMSR